jgi:Ca2+-transporting ATPase
MQSLSSHDAKRLLEKDGFNEITTKESISAFTLFLQQFPTVINAILAIGALFSFLAKGPVDGLFILAILLMNALLGFAQEFRAQKALEKLKEYSQPYATVLRDNKPTQIPAREIVVGDIVFLQEGDRVPADGVIIDSTHIEVDESILTGESLPVLKHTHDEAHQGTSVTRGKAYLKITQTGDRTQFGKIAATLASVKAEQTPLQLQILGLAKLLSFVAIILAVLIIPLGLNQGIDLLNLFVIATSLAIAAIPESLPAVITIALALGTNRMAKKHAIVKKLASIETVGAIQVVLTDKTGTITQNNMRVKAAWIPKDTDMTLMYASALIGNTAFIDADKGEEEVVGDKTDSALLLWGRAGIAPLKSQAALVTDTKILDEYTFDQKTKTIATVATFGKDTYAFVRGATESIIERSTLSARQKTAIDGHMQELAAQGLRVIALACKKESRARMSTREKVESNLTFLGLLGLYDPPRAEAKEAILTAHKAGINVVMVTGDNPLTAEAIAREVGIISKKERVITGDMLSQITEEELQSIITHVHVFARVKPEDKLRLVEAFKKAGRIVAVTGDGVNDALALKRADVGLAMGQRGTDVAKEAADIILSDDNFATLITAVQEGRKIYSNLVRTIIYLVTGNLTQMGLILGATAMGMPLPLLPTQILWINLVADGLPALALANDNHTHHLMDRPPRPAKQHILNRENLLFIFTVGLLCCGIFLGAFAYMTSAHSLESSRAILFHMIVGFRLALAFVVRKSLSVNENLFLLFTVLLTIALQVIIQFTPFFASVLHLR